MRKNLAKHINRTPLLRYEDGGKKSKQRGNTDVPSSLELSRGNKQSARVRQIQIILLPEERWAPSKRRGARIRPGNTSRTRLPCSLYRSSYHSVYASRGLRSLPYYPRLRNGSVHSPRCRCRCRCGRCSCGVSPHTVSCPLSKLRSQKPPCTAR